MKKIKLTLFCTLMTLILALSLVSCTDNGSSGGTHAAKMMDNIDKYTIVRSMECSQTIKSAASELQGGLAKSAEVKITSVTDSKDEAKYEIVLGKTARDTGFDYSTLSMGDFIIKLQGEKIIIAGGSDRATSEAVTFFLENLVDKSGVRIPTGDGYLHANNNAYNSITVDGASIEGFTVVSNVFDKETLPDEFVSQLEKATYVTLPLVDYKNIESVEGNYIMLDDTNIDFENYQIKFENGNIILYANHYTMQDCINAFFKDVLGYDMAGGKITGSRDLALSEANAKSYSVEKSPIYTKEKLLSVMEEVYADDSKLIIGQHMYSSDPGNRMLLEREQFVEECGVDSALYGYDLGDMIRESSYNKNSATKLAYDMIEYMREGGMITISVHFSTPVNLPEDEAAYRGELGYEDKWEALITEGTEYNDDFMSELTKVGDFLEIFKENDAPIIFRPLHEANGNWFWFGIIGKENYTEKLLPSECLVNLWKYMQNYLINERGIDNMLWEYSPNVAKRNPIPTGTQEVMSYYPGDEYCDIVGVDWYTSTYEGHEEITIAHEDLAMKTGKVFSLCEFGPGDDIRNIGEGNYSYTATHLDRQIMEVIDDGIPLCYWLLWSSWGEGDTRVNISLWNMGDGNLFYEDNDIYLDLSEVSKLLYD